MADLPPPPPGFTLDSAGSAPPPPPKGFKLDKPAAESAASDMAKSAVSLPERIGTGAVMALPNLINQAVEGPQMLYRGLTGREHDDSPLWDPFYSSEDFLQSMPGAIRPHVPTTPAGKATDLIGNLVTQVALGKEGLNPKIGPAVEKAAVNSQIAKDETGFGRSAVQKEIRSEDTANAHIAKAMLKAGHSPQEIIDIMNKAKNQGLTVGEAAKNPKLLGLESKISGMNRPGGKTMREFAKERVNPQHNTSVQQRLQAMADPMLIKMKAASDNIKRLVNTAPKTPLNMSGIKDSLAHEEFIPGTPIATTIRKLNEYSDWARSQGDTFAAWHKVKQNIWDLKSEAKNPSAPEKLDAATVKKYYKKVNDVLSRRTPGLPDDLKATGGNYAAQNDVYRQHLAGKTISDIVKKAPTGGTPAATMSYLYKNLAGNPETQEKLFGTMPVKTQRGMVEFLGALKDAARGNLRDVSKSVQEGSASFPKTRHAAVQKISDWFIDALTRKDYDALAKALTNPDVEEIARKIGYRSTAPSPKEVHDIIEETLASEAGPTAYHPPLHRPPTRITIPGKLGPARVPTEFDNTLRQIGQP